MNMRLLSKLMALAVIAGWSLIGVNGASLMTKLWDFNGTSGNKAPVGTLIKGNDGNYYGTSWQGGGNNTGSVYRYNPTTGIYTDLYSFTGGIDGACPYAGLTQGQNATGATCFYGTTTTGGTNGYGTLFRVSYPAGAVTILYSFGSGNMAGGKPYGNLKWGVGGLLYGTTAYGGPYDFGCVFAFDPRSNVMRGQTFFTSIGNDGGWPYGVLASGATSYAYSQTRNPTSGTIETETWTTNCIYYGTTWGGGAFSMGCIYEAPFTLTKTYSYLLGITVWGWSASGIITRYSFSGGLDGRNPYAGLSVASDGNYYGSTVNGGSNNCGTIYRFKQDNSFASLYSFAGGDAGENPYSMLVSGLGSVNLYGTTINGGSSSNGTIFKINAVGATALFTNLYSFTEAVDGGSPYAGMMSVGPGIFAGTTGSGGACGLGTIYKFMPDGAGLTVTASPAMGGTVTGGGNYLVGELVWISALANTNTTPNYAFMGWNDGSTDNPRAITIPVSNVTYSAIFAQYADISVLANPVASGTVSGTGRYQIGLPAPISASANYGWVFSGWSDGGFDNPRIITIPPTNITYTANFTQQVVSLSVNGVPADGGIVTGAGRYTAGSYQTISATASNGFLFACWQDGDTNPVRYIYLPTNDITYSANFVLSPKTLTLLVNTNAGGTVLGGGSYTPGSTQTISAVSSAGWNFARWSDGNTQSDRLIIVPESNVTYTAIFGMAATVTLGDLNQTYDGTARLVTTTTLPAGLTVDLTYNGSPLAPTNAGSYAVTGTVNDAVYAGWTNGTLVVSSLLTGQAAPTNAGSISGGGLYQPGSNVTLAATASNNWLFTQWNDGETNTSRSVVVPATNITYTANFASAATLTVGANTNAGGSVTGNGTFFLGSNVTLTATASNGWLFICWNDGETNATRNILVASNVTYTAVFALTAVLTVQANPTSGGRVSGGGTYFVGSNALLTAVASNLWQFMSWSDGNTNASRTVVVPGGGATYTANFAPLGAITVVASPTNGGDVTGGGIYLLGSNATVTATASNSWMFLNWNGSITNNPWVFSVVSNSMVCTANFARPVSVNVAAIPPYAGSVSGGGLQPAGKTLTLTALAAPGWVFSRWNDGNTNASRSITVPATNITYTATFAMGLGVALNASNFTWSAGGSAPWSVQTATTRDGIAARSGVISSGQQTWMQTTTNGPLSLMFWWKVSSAPTNYLQFYINTQLVSQISGNVNWNQYVTFLGTTNQYTLKWVYTKNSAAVSGSDAGFVDQVTVLPCPYATNVPQLFFQDSSGLLASWILNSTGGLQFARVLANSGSWALKTAGDINGDGVSDLIFQNSTSDTGGWFLNPDGSVRDARFWFNIGAWEIKAAGDYDGIGRAQLFFQTASGAVAYWRLDTNGAFQSAVSLGNMPGWKLRGAGDLDKDGKAELFWQNAAGQVVIWWHNPNGTIRSALAFTTGEWALCGVTDVDGDGICDLIWQAPDSRTGGWFMQTNGIARDARFWWPTGGWKLKAAGR